MRGGGVNGGLSGPDSTWGIRSEEGSASGVDIFVMGFDRVTRGEVRLHPSAFVRIPIWFDASSHHLFGTVSTDLAGFCERSDRR